MRHFEQGDRVQLRKDSYYYGRDENIPPNVIATCEDDEDDDEEVEVKWVYEGEEHYRLYSIDDLILTPKIVHPTLII